MSQGAPDQVSLRRRFLLILGLAVAALGAAGLAIRELRAQGASERARRAVEHGDAVVSALVRRASEASPEERADPDFPQSQREVTAALIAPLVDASAGFCLPTGMLVLSETVAPTAFGSDPQPAGFERVRAPSLLPLDRDVVQRACRTFPAEHDGHVRFAAPNDLLFVAIREAPGPWLAWALVRMPNRPGETPGAFWAGTLGLLGLLTLSLVVLTANSLLVLRRGSSELQRALARLQHDLRAEIPQPRVEELARLADGLRAMASHLTEVQRRERELERELGQQQRLAGLGRVVAGVAHEIRNPLAGMKLKLDTMARRRLDDRSARDVGVCLQEIKRLDRVVSSLLLVARRGPVDKQLVALAPLVLERMEAAQALAEATSVRLRCAGQAEAMACQEHLIRVVDNLLRNAIEASPPGGLVAVSIAQTPAGASVSVVDHGPGVPAEREGELFEPFFTLKPEGTGLGLFLSRSLIEAHGGHLTHRRDGAQTCFEFTLPCEPDHA